MSDVELAGMWLAMLGAGLAGCVVAHALGLASTYVRDLLHVGAGVWILGWPWWDGAALPVAIVATVALGTVLVPIVAPRIRIAARLVRSVSGGDERWTGLVHYTLAYAALTAIGLTIEPFPAAAALLALSLGDGIGGAVGRAYGRRHFQAPGGKTKSLEGSLAVAVTACLGIAIAAHLFDPGVDVTTIAVLGIVAAAAEAFAPRSTDNLLIPVAVWLAATVVS